MTDYPMHGTPEHPHVLTIHAHRSTGSKPTFSAWFRGEEIAHSWSPEFSAARVLKGLGYTGTLVTQWAQGQVVAMTMDLELAAKLTVTEGNASPKIAEYTPHPGIEATAED